MCLSTTIIIDAGANIDIVIYYTHLSTRHTSTSGIDQGVALAKWLTRDIVECDCRLRVKPRQFFRIRRMLGGGQLDLELVQLGKSLIGFGIIEFRLFSQNQNVLGSLLLCFGRLFKLTD